MFCSEILARAATPAGGSAAPANRASGRGEEGDREGTHPLPDRVGTNGVFAEGPHIRYMLSWFVLSAHMLPHVAIFVDMCVTCGRGSEGAIR